MSVILLLSAPSGVSTDPPQIDLPTPLFIHARVTTLAIAGNVTEMSVDGDDDGV